MLAIGARKHEHQPGTTFRVFLDPAGHPFCLCLEPRRRLECVPARRVGTPLVPTGIQEVAMGTDDKIANKAEELKGKAKETTGRATDDEQLEAEGRADQASGNLKQAGEKIKDVFKS